MCGIAGFVGRGDRGDLVRMTRAIAHRGPDADGHWVDEERAVHLGHRRLAIVDLAGGGQPMWTTDGAVGVVFNGEIYNHSELREELKARGCVFQTDHSDTEVLLHGYREWGDGFVARLNGMWAFALYDRTAGRLLLSRDRFGKKPLYWFCEGGTFAFGSELTALLAHPACPRSISTASLQKFFAYALIPAPRSILDRVSKLPGGHNLTFDLREGTPRISRYWDYVLEPSESQKSDDELACAVELEKVIAFVREKGKVIPVEEVVPSDVIIPAADMTVTEARQYLQKGDEAVAADASTSAGNSGE